MKKTLYFEGAGCVPRGELENCRIRTAFHLDDGRPVYLEIIGMKLEKHMAAEIYQWQYTGFVDYCHYITDDVSNDDCNNHRVMLPKKRGTKRSTVEKNTRLEYTEAEILRFVNSLGASFDAIKVVPDLGGYSVFKDGYSPKGTERYNYGDEFHFDPEMTARREAVYKKVYEIEYSELKADKESHGHKLVHGPGGIYPNFSLWVDPDDPGILHLLRHYNGYNRHWWIRTDTGSNIEDMIATTKEEPLGQYGY